MKFYAPELNKSFETKDEMFTALKAEAKEIIAEKKSVTKEADGLGIVSITGGSSVVKEALKNLDKSVNYAKEIKALPKLIVKFVSNTTNFFDTHRDVHIGGLWNNTIAENGQNGFPHIQEHESSFANVISDGMDVKTYLEETTFKALGFINYEGATQALKVESSIDPNRNIFMYGQYANGWVKNHSVGMRYVTIIFCANSEMESMAEEKAEWDKYYPLISNKTDVEAVGYFWAVTEAILREHSAVVFGSNKITPTESVEIEAEPEKQMQIQKRRIIY